MISNLVDNIEKKHYKAYQINKNERKVLTFYN